MFCAAIDELGPKITSAPNFFAAGASGPYWEWWKEGIPAFIFPLMHSMPAEPAWGLVLSAYGDSPLLLPNIDHGSTPRVGLVLYIDVLARTHANTVSTVPNWFTLTAVHSTDRANNCMSERVVS